MWIKAMIRPVARFLRKYAVLLAAFLPALVLAQTGQPGYLVVRDSSRVWITGTSTVGEYECSASSPHGFAFGSEGLWEAGVKIRVQDFDCGNDGMNDDMREALKMETFPEISYEPLSWKKAGEMLFAVIGELTIAGSRDTIAHLVRIESFTNETYRFTGKETLLMTRFGVTPPTALFGLIKARDEFFIHFDILVREDDTLSSF